LLCILEVLIGIGSEFQLMFTDKVNML